MPFTRKAPTIYPDTQSPFTAFQKGYEDESNKIARKEKEKKLEERQKTLWDREDTLWNQSQAAYDKKLSKEEKEEAKKQQIAHYSKLIFGGLMGNGGQRMEEAPEPTGVMGSERAMSPLARQTGGEPASEGLGQPSGQNLRREPEQQLQRPKQPQQLGGALNTEQAKQLFNQIPAQYQEGVADYLSGLAENTDTFNGMMDGIEEDRQDAILQTVVDNPDYINQERYQEKQYESIIDNMGKVSPKLLREDYQEYKDNVIKMADTLYNDLVSKEYLPSRANEIRKAFLTENLKENPFESEEYIDKVLENMKIDLSGFVLNNDLEGAEEDIQAGQDYLERNGASWREAFDWANKQRNDIIQNIARLHKKSSKSGSKQSGSFSNLNDGTNEIYSLTPSVPVDKQTGNAIISPIGDNKKVRVTNVQQKQYDTYLSSLDLVRGSKIVSTTYDEAEINMLFADILNSSFNEDKVGGVTSQDFTQELNNRVSQELVTDEQRKVLLKFLYSTTGTNHGRPDSGVVNLNVKRLIKQVAVSLSQTNSFAGRTFRGIQGISSLSDGGVNAIREIEFLEEGASWYEGLASWGSNVLTSEAAKADLQHIFHRHEESRKFITNVDKAAYNKAEFSLNQILDSGDNFIKLLELSKKLGYTDFKKFKKDFIDGQLSQFQSSRNTPTYTTEKTLTDFMEENSNQDDVPVDDSKMELVIDNAWNQ